MFDKQEQLRRAQQINQQNAQAGVTPPALPIPRPAIKVPRDKRGNEIKLNDTVVRSHPEKADLLICKVTKIVGEKVYLDNSHTPLIYNNRIAVL